MTLTDLLHRLENNEDITFLFAGASRLDRAKVLDKLRAKFTAYNSADWERREEIIQGELEQQLAYDGVKRFKRRALGLCGSSTIKSVDQMLQLLYETGVASSPEEAREILPHLKRKYALYYISAGPFSGMSGISFQEVRNYSGFLDYKIELGSANLGLDD